MAVLDIALLKIKMVLKDKTSLAWMILAPVVFISVVVYGFEGTQNKCGVSIVDNDQSIYSKEFIELLKENEEYPIEEKTDINAKESLVDGKSIAIINIPQGFSDMLEESDSDKKLEIVKLRDNQRIRALQNILENNFNKLKIKNIVGKESVDTITNIFTDIPQYKQSEIEKNIKNEYNKKINEPKIVTVVSDESNENNSISSISYSTIGIMILFIMFFVVTSGGSFVDEKKNGTLNRIRSTSTSNIKIILGYVLGLVIIGWIQATILLVIGKYVYDINWGSSLLGIILLFTAFLGSVSTLSILIANIANNRKQLTSIIAIIVMPTSLLGGCMWSKELMSDFLLNISYFTPQSWVIDGLIDLMQRDGNINSVYIPSAMLCIFAAVFFITCIIVLKVKEGRRG